MEWLARLPLALILIPACRGVTTDYRYPYDLTHPNYVKRTKAAREFAGSRDRAQLPEAFDLLMDEEAHIRSLAYEAIKAMSADGTDFGYRSYLPAAVRIGIVERWEAWWVAQEAARG